MKDVILIYQTDPWLSRSSQELIAIATTERQRDILVREFLTHGLYEKPGRDLLAEAMRQLREGGQTQCLAERCDLEIYTEYITPNTLLQ